MTYFFFLTFDNCCIQKINSNLYFRFRGISFVGWLAICNFHKICQNYLSEISCVKISLKRVTSNYVSNKLFLIHELDCNTLTTCDSPLLFSFFYSFSFPARIDRLYHFFPVNEFIYLSSIRLFQFQHARVHLFFIHYPPTYFPIILRTPAHPF